MAQMIQKSMSNPYPLYSQKLILPKKSVSTAFNTCLQDSSCTEFNDDQYELTFESKYDGVLDNTQPEFIKYNQIEATYHKSDNLLGNLKKSLEYIKDKKQTRQVGLIYHIVHQLWIPYILKKYRMLLYVDSGSWLEKFEDDFNYLHSLILRVLLKYYPTIQNTETNNISTIFRTLSQQIAYNKKWELINDIIIKLVSRLRIPLQQNQCITREIFNLPANVQTLIQEIKPVLNSLYFSQHIMVKKEKIRQFLGCVLKSQNAYQLQLQMEYCFLVIPCSGMDEIIRYVTFFMKYQLSCQEKERLETIQKSILRLRQRDITGFIWNPSLKPQLSKQSWQFVPSKINSFKFINPSKVEHNQVNWQEIVSKNFIRSGTKIPIKIDVNKNFIKVGLIRYDGTQTVEDYSNSQGILSYSFFSGRIRNFHKSQTTTKRFHKISQITLKIDENKISWIVKSKNPFVENAVEETDTIEKEFSYNPEEEYRVYVSFRKGKIEVFPP